MKKLFLILFCLLLAISASAAYVYDGADLYTDAEELMLSTEAATVYENSGIFCVLLTGHGIGDITAELPSYAGGMVDMALHTGDMTAREFYLYQYNAEDGESAFRISTAESDGILDGILPEMADGEYFQAALTYLELTENAFNASEVFSPSVTDEEYVYIEYPEDEYDREYTYSEDGGFAWEVLGTASLVGVIAGGIAVLCVWLSYKRKVHGTIYPLGEFANLALREQHDNYTHTTRTRVRVSDSSSGGGHSGGSRSSGGGFRGGGGARMGGRKF